MTEIIKVPVQPDSYEVREAKHQIRDSNGKDWLSIALDGTITLGEGITTTDEASLLIWESLIEMAKNAGFRSL